MTSQNGQAAVKKLTAMILAAIMMPIQPSSVQLDRRRPAIMPQKMRAGMAAPLMIAKTPPAKAVDRPWASSRKITMKERMAI